ncbi:hypothetical protein F5141DRAFT_1211125 [Pisolithus sp. B1]|nr:hypothetical protein F5141DRAFT_1211125 [Pisolithus sp. B1]
MAPASVTGSHSSALGRAPLTWRPTKIMNVRDLSKDDDFLSHLLVEKLGTGGVPLYVHKMDPSRRLPKVDAGDLMGIVRRMVESKSGPQIAVRQAVDGLLALSPVRYYLRPYTQKQINAFATHASRYFELYNPNGSIEIAHTSRYSHMTGKSELCILATRPLTPGVVIAELKDLRTSDIRRDFSVIHSRQMKKNHLFLGPARFVNHDCENNCELFREGKYITFRVVRPVAVGEEITAHYGDGYFGKRNRYCLCETCEKNGRGGYTPENNNGGSNSEVGGSEDDFSDSEPTPAAVANVNERRTRRGVYAIIQEQDDDSDESEDEEKETNRPLANVPDMGDVDLELGGHPSSSRLPSTRRSVSSSVPPSRTSEVPDNTAESFKPRVSTGSQRHSVSVTATPTISVKSLTPLLSVPHVSRGCYEDVTRLSTPLGGRGKEKEKVPIKEEPEARVLRTRPSLHTEKDEPLSTSKSTVPLGSDGHPLPTCVTCCNILPVISVNNKVVWGLSVDTPPRRGRKRKEPQECPRCMRHFAIYGHAWPARLPNQVVSHSGRDDADTFRRSGPKTSSITERKRSAGEERPQKKSKADQMAIVEMSSKAKEMLTPPKRKRGRPRKYPPPEEEPPKRKRGRPRIHSPCRSRSLVPAKSVATGPRPCSLASVRSKSDQSSTSESGHLGVESSVTQEQPRDPKGRFGKKGATNGRSMRGLTPPLATHLTRNQRMLQRTKVKQWLEDNRDHDAEMAVQTNGKRNIPVEVDASPRPTKRLRNSRARTMDGDDDPMPVSVSGSMSFRFSGVNGSLLCRPNPTNFARRKWAPDLPGEDSTHEDDDMENSLRTSESDSNGPVTPEDRTPLPLLGPVPCAETHLIQLPNTSPRRPIRGAHAESITSVLIYKPSPVNFARRRWHSATKSPLETGSGTRRSQRLRPRTSCTEDDVQSHPVGLLSTQPTLAARSVSPGKNPKSDGEPPAAPEANPGDFSISAARHGTGLNGHKSLVSTSSEGDRAPGGLLAEGLATHTPSATENTLSHLRVTYATELPAVVPWKNAQATPMSQYLKKSASFHGNDFSSPTHLVHAGWDDSTSDVLSD